MKVSSAVLLNDKSPARTGLAKTEGLGSPVRIAFLSVKVKAGNFHSLKITHGLKGINLINSLLEEGVLCHHVQSAPELFLSVWSRSR